MLFAEQKPHATTMTHLLTSRLVNRKRFSHFAYGIVAVLVVVSLTVTCLTARQLYDKHIIDNTPTQVHIAQGNNDGTSMIITWVTQTEQSGQVSFWPKGSSQVTIVNQTEGFQYSYEYYFQRGSYTSGFIHHVNISGLQPFTVYEYECGWAQYVSQVFSFQPWGSEPVTTNPFTFFLIGDLGQTTDSKSTRDHMIAANMPYAPTLLIGDLSYADSSSADFRLKPCTQTRWDSWGELMQPLSSSSPLMILPGNHEIEYNPEVKSQVPFYAFQNRFRMPAATSGAPQRNLFYSFNAPSTHVIMLNSYDGLTQEGPFDSSTQQYQWLIRDLKSIDRSKFPWVIAAMHAPWYNSNTAHHDEVQETDMRASFEPLFREYGVDVVFAGHVHAYERMFPVYNNKTEAGATTYINIGDGGNREGPASFYYTQPIWSAFREPQFGHGQLKIFNSTHAYWSWHRNIDSVDVIGDQIWLVKNSFLGTHSKGVTAFAYEESTF